MLTNTNSSFSLVVTDQFLGATISFCLENRLCDALQLDDYLPAANQLCSTDTLDWTHASALSQNPTFAQNLATPGPRYAELLIS